MSYSMVVLYIRDHGGLGFSDQQYHPKTSFTIPAPWQYWLGITKPDSALQIDGNFFQVIQ